MTRSTHRKQGLAAALVLAGLAAPAMAAAATAGTDDTTPTTSAATEGTTGDTAVPPTFEPLEIEGDPACTPYVGVTQALSSEAPDPEAITEMLDELDAAIPEDLAESLPVMTGAAREVLASGGEDFGPFETPEFTEAQAAVDVWMFENCDFEQKLEVTTVEYGFDDLPEELEAGVTAILLTNDGAQMHEIAMLRRNEGVTESWEELLELPEEEAMSKAAFVGAGFVPMTGSTTLVVADLEPGDYAALCFVPVGSMMHEDGEMTEGTGPPHFVEGMMQEFTVVD
jgi:hypothetical protein